MVSDLSTFFDDAAPLRTDDAEELAGASVLVLLR